MTETLVTRLIPVNNRMSALADRLGVPQYTTVVLKVGTTYTELVPRPKVVSMTKRDVVRFLSHSVDVNQDDLWLEDIPRTFAPEVLGAATFILNAQSTTSLTVPWVGINTQALFVDRNQLLTYKVLVRKQRAR